MEIVFGISAGYLNNEMGFHTRYELITPQTALLMNFTEIILVLLICRFGSKEKEKNSDHMIFILFSNEKNHGIGTRSVLAFVNKTNSEIHYLAEEKRFRVRMII